MRHLTVVIPTLNEETDLPETLKSVKFAEEVLVVDTGSTDNTVEIAKKLGAKVVKQEFKNYAQIRNVGDQLAKNDWVLHLDADSPVPASLAKEITSLPDEPSVYKIGRVNLIWGKPILHTDWGPRDDNHIRLYHKSLGKWQGRVHETIATKVKPKQLKHFLIHHNYTSVSEVLRKVDAFSEITAQNQAGTKKFSYISLFYDPLYDFGKRYFYKLGFLDGLHGLFLSFLQAIYHLSVNVKLYQLTK